jgi:8-oxo-dGTP diphosphatase
VSADALIRDQAGRVLVVNPAYKPGWDLPGGMAEANEAPADAVRRELLEELGLRVRVGALLCVDWVAPHGPWDDLIAFVFDGGVLDEVAAADLRVRDHELAGFEFCDAGQLRGRLEPRAFRRAQAALNALAAGQASYLHDGLEP